MNIDYCFPARRLFPVTVLVASDRILLVEERLPVELQASPADIDVSTLTLRGEVPLSDITFIKGNKQNCYVAISHDPWKIESSTTAFDLESTEARELFLEVVGDRLPGGSIREEDAYGPFQNILGPATAVACSLFMAVASGLDLLRRGFDWQAALILAVGVFFSLGTLGWLVERLKKPAIIILIEPKLPRNVAAILKELEQEGFYALADGSFDSRAGKKINRGAVSGAYRQSHE